MPWLIEEVVFFLPKTLKLLFAISIVSSILKMRLGEHLN